MILFLLIKNKLDQKHKFLQKLFAHKNLQSSIKFNE